MADYQKATPGEPFQPSARLHNDLIDLLQQFGGGPSQRPNVKGRRRTDLVLIQNNTGDDLDLWDAVGIDSLMVTAADVGDDDDKLTQNVGFVVVAPLEDQHKGRFAICWEPIKDGGFGWACFTGVTWAQVNIADGADKTADIGDSGYVLDSGNDGVATILAASGGTYGNWTTGNQFCLVRIGGGGGASLPTGQYQHQVVTYMVSQNQIGASFILSHPMV